MRLGLALAVCIALGLLGGAREARAQVLYPASQFGNVDLVPTQGSGNAAAALLESLGAKTDRFEPMSRFREDDPFRQAGRSVGRLDIEVKDSSGVTGIATCTATLISPDSIITNAHCIPGLGGDKVIRAEVRFGYLRLGDAGSKAFPVAVDPVETNRTLDYSILAVSGEPSKLFPIATRANRAALDNESLYLIHHPAGQPQKLTRAFCRAHPEKAVEGTHVRHQCDTLPGSSGSLIFALSDGAIVGLHHSGGLSPNDDLSFNRGTDVLALHRHSRRLAPPPAEPKPVAHLRPSPWRMEETPDQRSPAPKQQDPVAALQPGSGKTNWARDTLKDGSPCPFCPEMVVVPEGKFSMGSPASETEMRALKNNESPQIDITIAKQFAVGRFAVTRGEFATFIEETGHTTYGGCFTSAASEVKQQADKSWRSTGFAQDDRHPVVCVNWDDAQAYARWLSDKTGKQYRLPSEAEREYVTRAGTSTPFWWGAQISTAQANYDGSKTYDGGSNGEYRKATVTVDSFAANTWGLYNVHGNVWEWTEDCWSDSHAGNPGDGSARTAGDCYRRAARGGSWSFDPWFLRAGHRSRGEVGMRSHNLGFRVARSLP